MSLPPSSNPEIILASASAARASLLRQAGVPLTVKASHVDEAALKHALAAEAAAPRAVADSLAEAKAVKVSARRPGLVIGADSVLELDGALFDKPCDLAEARGHLLALQGRTHTLHSAAVIAEGGAAVWRQVSSAALTMRPLSADFLDDYIAREGDTLLGSVGCYRLEGLGAQLFTALKGDYFTVLGLPLLPVLDFLRVRGALAS